MPAGRGGPETEGHQHVDCPPDQRRWLESRLEQAATMRPHTYCVGCGRVKQADGPRARRLGFYRSGLSALKEYLARRSHHGKMTQSQSRLITKTLEGLEDFDDPYGLGLEVQSRLYLQAVKGVRPDLENELVLCLLPKGERSPRSPSWRQ